MEIVFQDERGEVVGGQPGPVFQAGPAAWTPVSTVVHITDRVAEARCHPSLPQVQ